MSTAVRLYPTVPVVQNVRPSGENPLSWPKSPDGVDDSSLGCRQSVLMS
jgi:hypothetical protein